MDFPDVDPGRTGELETRPRRAETQPGNPNPKTGMLGLTPRHVYKGDPPKTCNQVFGATPKIIIYRVGAEDDKEKQKCVSLC